MALPLTAAGAKRTLSVVPVVPKKPIVAEYGSARGNLREMIVGGQEFEVTMLLPDVIDELDASLNDTLTFDLRVDTDKIPSDLLRAYYAVELKALSKNNPSGFASARQKREAKEIARERLVKLHRRHLAAHLEKTKGWTFTHIE